MASKVHEVTSTRVDLAAALNAAEGVRDIKVGKSALNKLVKQTEALLAPDERVEFATYYYERGLTMVTYYVIVLTDRRIMRVKRTTWKLDPWIEDRSTVTGVDVSAGSQTPRVTLHRGEAIVAPFMLVRADAESLARHLGAAPGQA